MLQSGWQRIWEAFLEGRSAPRLEKTVHLELWEWGAGGSLKKPGKSGGAWGQTWYSTHVPKGAGSQCSVHTAPGLLWGEAGGAPCGRQTAGRLLMGCVGNDCCYGNEKTASLFMVVAVGRQSCSASPRHHLDDRVSHAGATGKWLARLVSLSCPRGVRGGGMRARRPGRSQGK